MKGFKTKPNPHFKIKLHHQTSPPNRPFTKLGVKGALSLALPGRGGSQKNLRISGKKQNHST
jgi:hypothetical protein